MVQRLQRHRLYLKPLQRRLRNILCATGRPQLLTRDDIALPVLEIECLNDAGSTRGLTREGGDEEHPVVGNRAIALQHLRLSGDIPPVIRCATFGDALVRRRLYLERCAVLHDEVEGSIHLASRRQAVKDIADKILGEHADVGVLVCQIPKRPAVEGKDLKETGYWR